MLQLFCSPDWYSVYSVSPKCEQHRVCPRLPRPRLAAEAGAGVPARAKQLRRPDAGEQLGLLLRDARREEQLHKGLLPNGVDGKTVR
jgi:hypothetical protein